MTYRLEQGSFRDPNSRVFYSDDGVLRALSDEALADWNAVAATGLLPALLAEGKVVATELVEPPPDLPPLLKRDTAALLRHEVVPFVSYPYEWTFGMLRDAALLQLDLLLAAVAEDVILKDASPYNVQWRGARPVFIDMGSFERLEEGEPWVGYRQFCMLFLYPLLLQAYKGVPFQPWLRGSIDGIEPEECAALMTRRDLLRAGVLSHVVLHARLQTRYGASERDVKGELRAAGFRKELIEANLKRLQKLVRRLRWEPPRTVWSEYGTTTTYTEADAERKASFVRSAAGSREWRLAWDLGANDGTFSRLAAESARYVVAMDADHGVVDRLYRGLSAEGERRILPLVANLADPSPGLGWRGLERKPLPERGKPELTLALALVHHVSIAHNIPVADFLAWLASLDAHLVVEFVAPEDPMARRLLAAKKPGTHPDYTTEFFERALGERFDVERREELASGTRILYFARPKA